MTNLLQPGAFVYVEAQSSIPFGEYQTWEKDNEGIRAQTGFINKTWLSGADDNSIGGFYAFDTIENAKKYVHGFMANKAKELNIGVTMRIFDAQAAKEASTGLFSPYFV